MPLKDMSKLLNELAIQNRERQWHLFYEVKSTLGRQAMARMACAGVAEIQPGIESFSSNTLRMMNKGATSLQQVNLLKWAKAYGVTVRYPILVGTPGETAADLRQVKSVLTSISHLDLPTQINRLALLKGSPYWAAPEATGIVDVRPREASEWIYQTDARSTLALEGQAAYRNPTWDTEEYQEALIDLEDTLDAMHRRINPMVSGYYRGDGAWVVTRSEYTGALTMEIISDATEVAILEASEQIGTRAGVARKLNKSLAELDIAVSALVERGLVLSDKDRLLALPLPFDASAAVDAEWPPTLVDLGAHT